ncbi:MAG: phosphoenolpyruvate synthase [Gammaproteobacteria bacterium]|nr:phosphoenolpyruvate synthase [Gammaproteobacteria bacterium]
MNPYQYIRRFAELGIEDVALVGGKNASLGEMYRELSTELNRESGRALSGEGVKVPNGFATTAAAYRDYLRFNNLEQPIHDLLAALDVSDSQALSRCGARIRSWIYDAELPAQLSEEISAAYAELSAEYGDQLSVAVRSSATAEDLPNASFAGQQETYLNVRGNDNLLRSCKRVLASLFTDRAISYRVQQGFEHMQVALSIGVQLMVRSDKAASGVMFTLDTESGFRDAVFITAAYGLGENVVQGAVNPDEFYVFKPTLNEGYRPILKRQRGEKAIKMVYSDDPVTGVATRNVPVRREDRERFALNDDEVLELARSAIAIEKHYSAKAGKSRPMDIEWAKDGISGELFIVQARPETVHASQRGSLLETYTLEQRGEVICRGRSIGKKIAAGRARLILEAEHMSELQPGEILVTDITDPDWVPVMKIAGAIVTNRGGRTCHAAIVARELGIPAVVGCEDATQVIEPEQEITVSCAEGDSGYIYAGTLPFNREQRDVSALPRPKTRMMLNVANPERAFEFSALPNDGVGLARLEFIINTSIGIHPQALLQYDALHYPVWQQINPIIAGYDGPTEFYIERLAEGIGTIAAAFYPKPVIVRLSDFKSNEYAKLLGGKQFEPNEENPMIGFRGAARYPSPQFADCFAMECAALKKVRDTMGLDNVAIMIPFVRTAEEARTVIDLMTEQGLKRGENGLKIYLMCEIPANALLATEFLEQCDGFSIGSNDLTQLTLGVDRDSGLLTGYDERDDAVKCLMKMAIDACKSQQKYVGICGQAPSDFPEITRWLVERGIDSISLNPDSIIAMTEIVNEVEEALRR